jgi:rare lipoprotein A (peptidoglycan hydrolase)
VQATATATPTTTATTGPAHRRARPQVVEPVAGVVGAGTTSTSDPAPPAPSAQSTTPRLNQPATVSGGAAKGAPSDREVRAEIARFQLVVARYHLNRLDFSGVLLDPAQLPAGQYNVSIASVETLYGHRDACGGILRPRGLGVANKTLPCGTEVIFLYQGRAIRVPVVDRGPYIQGREWDLSGAAAEALHFPGLGPVQWRLG